MTESYRVLDPGARRRSPLDESIDRACDRLVGLQRDDGHWCAELEGDTILESEYVLLLHYLGRSEEERAHRAARYLRRKQLPDGGWAIHPGGPTEVSASVKAYFVLKLLGDSPDAPHMVRARRAILEAGGLDAVNSFTKIYLAIFGQLEWDACPSVPPEMVLLPRWFWFNIYEMSSWSRAIVVPLAIVRAHRPHCPVPEHASIAELRAGAPPRPKAGAWARLFRGLDGVLKLHEALPRKPFRRRALARSEHWILERLEGSDGLGAIFPPIINTILALHALGYALDHPIVRSQVRELERLEIDEDDTLRLQPCFSPVWDTALSMNALVEAGMRPDDPVLQRGARWLLARRGGEAGDWRVNNPHPGRPGWYFEYANPYYPDCDSTAQVLVALSKVHLGDREDEARRRALDEAAAWARSMQNRDGGWAAFDRGCDKKILTHVPFADHNAMIDPSTADITARMLEALAACGDRTSASVRRAVRFLRREQESDGAWYGRWGCNYLYGTWLALWGLDAVGEDVEDGRFARGADWIAGVQNDDGGWGESLQSYDDPSLRGRGRSTAAQTAWAMLGLMAAGRASSEPVRRGVRYLLATQHDDGGWIDENWTGTGFPRVFYLRYHLYATYFPLLALSVYKRLADGSDEVRLRSA